MRPLLVKNVLLAFIVQRVFYSKHLWTMTPFTAAKKNAPEGEEILLCEDDGDGVVEDALAKHKHVEHRVNVEGIEDGNGSDGVHS